MLFEGEEREEKRGEEKKRGEKASQVGGGDPETLATRRGDNREQYCVPNIHIRAKKKKNREKKGEKHLVSNRDVNPL